MEHLNDGTKLYKKFIQSEFFEIFFQKAQGVSIPFDMFYNIEFMN